MIEVFKKPPAPAPKSGYYISISGEWYPRKGERGFKRKVWIECGKYDEGACGIGLSPAAARAIAKNIVAAADRAEKEERLGS